MPESERIIRDFAAIRSLSVMTLTEDAQFHEKRHDTLDLITYEEKLNNICILYQNVVTVADAKYLKKKGNHVDHVRSFIREEEEEEIV